MSPHRPRGRASGQLWVWAAIDIFPSRALIIRKNTTTMGAEARPASLVRFVLLPNGEAFARFSDCSLIVLNAAAYAYALIEPDGKKTHGVCTCVRSALRPRLTAALHARNVLSPAAPRMVHDLLPPPFSESPVPTTAARHRFFDMPTSGGGGGLGRNGHGRRR